MVDLEKGYLGIKILVSFFTSLCLNFYTYNMVRAECISKHFLIIKHVNT